MFNTQQKQIIDSLKSPGAAKSWLIVGPYGIGKTNLAKAIIEDLTKNSNEYNPSVQWVECGLTDTAKKEIQKVLLAGEQLDNKEWAKKKEITVNDVREACHFLSLKSNKIKILVFNLADDMNEEAQNALLKTLEEPYPNSLILLLTENIGHLLPTIASRCQKVVLPPLSNTEISDILSKKHPELSENDRLEIAELADHMPGVAEDIISYNGLILYYKLQNLLAEGSLNSAAALDWAETAIKDKDTLRLACRFLLKIISKYAINRGVSIEKSFELSELYAKVQNLLRQMEQLNLDKKHTMTSIIQQISEVL